MKTVPTFEPAGVTGSRHTVQPAVTTFARQNGIVEEGTARLSPERLANAIALTQSEVAEIARVSDKTLKNNPESTKVQAGLTDLVRVLKAASDLTGSVRDAVIWFKYEPLSDYRYKTPMMLLMEGHAEAVLTHLERIADGVYS